MSASNPFNAPRPPAQETPRKTRQRSSIACQACNSRRVKCNAAAAGLPCSNCHRGGRECKLIDSKRGKRKPKGTETGAVVTLTVESEPPVRENPIAISATERDVPKGWGAVAFPTGEEQDVEAGPRRLRPADDNVTIDAAVEGQNAVAGHEQSDDVDGRTPANAASGSQTISTGREELHENCQIDSEGPEMLYAQMLEADKSHSSGDNNKQRKLIKPGGQVVYLGETFNLTYLLQQNLPVSNVSTLRSSLPVETQVLKTENLF